MSIYSSRRLKCNALETMKMPKRRILSKTGVL